MSENKDILNLDIEQFEKNLESKTVKVSVIGLGRIGLPTAVAMARVGLKTIGVDINKNIIEFVNQGKLRINDEPGLEEELQKVIIDKKFYAITKIDETIRNTDVIIVCLPTPLENNSKKTNYGFLLEGCSQIAHILKKRTLVIIESTVGPGIVENEIIPVLEKESGLKVGKDFLLASCPERANPSTILTDFNKIPRVVGGINELSTQLAAKLYRFVFNIDVVTVKNCKTANAVKVVENVFRDVNVAFINEIAIFCDRIGIDVKELIEGCKTKYNFIPHFPGPGVGGPCLPINPYQLLDAPESENILEMVKTARKVNSNMPNYVIELVKDALKETNKIIENVTIGILGISYKPNVGDIQLTPIEDIIKKLEQYKTKIKIFDPYFIGKIVFGIKLESNIENLIKNTDIIILGTDHDEFLNINFRNWKDLMNSSGIIIDTRGKISPSNIRNEGFIFRSIGRTS